MRIHAIVLCCATLVPALAPAAPAKAAGTHTVDLWLAHNLVRIDDVRFTRATDAILALQRERVASVRVLVCPLTYRENVDRLVDALIAADISIAQTKRLESREYRCADNARVETRAAS
ncbi:MAG: hypothetical protein JNK75_11585 [Betaproteobacteria bacterium]|nr:hypothetical protein [Betaproteobacteria bacterium]